MRKLSQIRRIRAAALAALPVAVWLAAGVHAQGVGLSDCGSLENAYGPFDYTDAYDYAERLPVVENAHFDRGVENFTGHVGKNKRDSTVAGDLDYTLRAFPNHHRALYAMARFYLRGLDKTLGRTHYTPECYFDRAMRFKPGDPKVRMIYGIYLHRSGKLDEAAAQYEVAELAMPDSPEIHYNLGLLFIDMRRYPEAREHAHKAYELGYPLPGLRNKLERLGQWDAPAADPQADLADGEVR